MLSTPNLEDLGFFVESSDHDHSGALKVPYLDCYQLQSLALDGISTPWETLAGPIGGLRSLTIVCLGNAAPSREQIGGILLVCPRLEELALSNLENHPSDFSLPPLFPSILSPPALRSVALIQVTSVRGVVNLIGLSVMGNWTSRDTPDRKYAEAPADRFSLPGCYGLP